MPKSRRDSIGSIHSSNDFDEEEMSRRISERLEGMEVDVQLPSRSRGGMENLRVFFTGGGADVLSESGNNYHVDIDNQTCTCPDHTHRHSRCRHIEAASIAQGQISQGISSGSIQDSLISPNQVTSEYLRNETDAEIQNSQREYRDDGFFYNDNPEQFREDSERLLREPIPYYYENVLNGSDITFGIELEFVNGDSDAIARELYDLGICSSPRMESYHSAGAPGKWKLEKDGSVTSYIDNRGGELVSPVLTDTPETWKTLETVCEVAKRHGAQVNFNTGGHIHIGAENTLDGKRQRWRRFFKMNYGFEDVFHRLSGGEQGVFRGIADDHYTESARSQSNIGITTRLPDEADIATYQNLISNISEDRYRSINLLPFASQKTIEFRAFNGTLTPEIIQANVKYAAGMVNAAERARTKESENFNVTEHDKRRGEIINNYEEIEESRSERAVMNVLDTVCSRKEDKEHILSVIVRNRWI